MDKISSFLRKKRYRTFSFPEGNLDDEKQKNFLKAKIEESKKEFQEDIIIFESLINLINESLKTKKTIKIKEFSDIINPPNINHICSSDDYITLDDFLTEINSLSESNSETSNKIDSIKAVSQHNNEIICIFLDKDDNIIKKNVIFTKPIFLNKLKLDDNTLNIKLVQTLGELMNDEVFVNSEEWKFKLFIKEGISFQKKDLNIEGNINLFIYEQDIKNISIENIYKDLKKNRKFIEPKDISHLYFYYCNYTNENIIKDYKFILTRERENLEKKLINFIVDPFENYFGLCGGKGIGKTCFFLYFCNNTFYRMFYFNMRIIHIAKPENRKKILNYEIKRLFYKQYNEEDIIIKEILDKINTTEENFDIISFLFFIIDKLQQFSRRQIEKDDIPITIILDEFLSEDENNYIQLKNKMKDCNLVKLIICFSLSLKITQNIFIKGIKNTNNDDFPLYYLSKLICEEEDFTYIIEKENSKFKEYIIKEFGFLPYNYYYIKRNDFSLSLEEFTNIIKDDFKAFFGENYVKELMNLLGLIKFNYLLNEDKLIDNLRHLPLEYLDITKIELDSDNIDWENCWNPNLLKYYFNIGSNSKKIDKYFLNLKFGSSNIIYEKFDNEKIFNTDYLIEDKNVVKYDLPKNNKKITLYKIDFLFPFIQHVINKIVYEEMKHNFIFLYFSNIKNERNVLISKKFEILKKILDEGTFGGFFELFVIYYINISKKICDVEIKQIKTVETICPSNFPIKFFSDRLIKKSKRNKDINYQKIYQIKENNKKISLEFKATFIKQKKCCGPYYDCVLLIPVESSTSKKDYIIIVFQISIKKSPIKYYSKN